MRRLYHGRKVLIERWNKYHPINREVARHIEALEQQGERIWGRWVPPSGCGILATNGVLHPQLLECVRKWKKKQSETV